MDKDIVAILGGRGMLGTDLTAVLLARGFAVEVYDLPDCDITKPDQIQEIVRDCDAVINCAAYSDVDGAEAQAEMAHKVNAEAVGCLGACVKELGKWVLHFSTDFVFDGRQDRPYVETDVPGPINEYGRSKLAGDHLLQESGCSHCIVRLEWTYGAHGTNFISKLVKKAGTKGGLRVVDDQIGSPTATAMVAQVVCQLLKQRAEGLFHLASADYVSRFGIAQFVAEQLGLNVGLEPCPSSDYRTPATRPLNSRFDCRKIQALLSEPIESWQGPLARFLRQHYVR